MASDRRPAFTLLELLIVIAIIAILSGMAMPVIGLARNAARSSETRSILAKADVAIRQFRTDTGTWPYQAHDGSAGFPEAENRLAWHLGHALSDDERRLLETDIAHVNSAYDTGAHLPVPADIFHRNGWSADRFIRKLTDMGKIRARAAVRSGNSGVKGIAGGRASRVLNAPGTGWAAASSAHPGWGDDYLAGEIPPKRMRGHALLDGWSVPLVYVSPVTPGVRFTDDRDLGGGRLVVIDERDYALGASGRTATQTLASDVRSTASETMATAYELSSCGRDGVTAPLRNDPLARDDLLAGPYRKALQ